MNRTVTTAAWAAALTASVSLGPGAARAEDPAVTMEVPPVQVAPGGPGLLRVELTLPKGWHLWAMEPGGPPDGPGPMPLDIRVVPGLGFEGPWYGPAPEPKYDKGFKADLLQWELHQVRLERAFVAPDPLPEEGLTVRLMGQICTDRQCLTQRLHAPLQLVADPEAASPSAPAGVPLQTPPGASASALPNATDTGDGAAADEPRAPADATQVPAALGGGDGSLFTFLFFAFLFGLGALATPCVFPAIPLTVSFFSKYRSTGLGRTVALAGTYAGTMVVAFAGAGVAVSVLFGVTGIQRFAAHPVFNLALGLLLTAFALNLMGLFEVQVPSWMLSTVNRMEQRFGRSSERAKQGGWFDFVVVGVAALTATTVFFTCTVGFVGVVLVAAAQGELIWPTLGMLAFASAFALPFFLLALFPRAAQSLRASSGSWMHSTRVVLGFLELAAATKFLSNADLVWRWELLTRDVILALWVPMFIVAGMFLLGKIRIGEPVAPEGPAPVGQVLAAVCMLAFSTYLATGLFQNRAFGSWLDGWLPPLRYPGLSASASGIGQGAPGLDWSEDLEAARRTAEAERKLVFLNYTGYTCTNCRYMEEAVFPRPEVAELLREMELVELYTDGGEPMHEAYRQDQVERFGTAALPFYSIETPDGRVLATFESSTNDPRAFRQFLERARAAASQS